MSDDRWDRFNDHVLDFVLASMRSGKRVALVTLVEIDGSSPWRPGAQMAVSETGEWVGYLSGGCIERAVAAGAIQAIEAGRSRRVRYGTGSPYLDIQLPCGSAIELIVDVDVAEREIAMIQQRLSQRQEAELIIEDPACRDRDAQRRIARRYLPRRRLVVAGVGPVPVLLSRLSRSSGFEVKLVSPDETTVEAVAADGMDAIQIHPNSNLSVLGIDARTAVVLAFHDHDWDMALLPDIIGSAAFYVGAMGSVMTHQLRAERLREAGFDADAVAAVHGPAGILSGARGAAEIAVSILAEILQVEARLIERKGLLVVSNRILDEDDDSASTSFSNCRYVALESNAPF